MTNQEIRATLRRFLEDELQLGAFADDESLIENGMLSSMAMNRLVPFMSERFQVSVDDALYEPESFETLDAMTALVARKRGG